MHDDELETHPTDPIDYWRTVLRALFDRSRMAAGKAAPWDHCCEQSRAEAVNALSHLIVAKRCEGAPQAYKLWTELLDTDSKASANEATKLKAFITSVLGSPENSGNTDHLEGLVSEFLWWALVDHAPNERINSIEHVTPPKGFHVTGPGGDGLVFFRCLEGKLRFRLWEMKKHATHSPISSSCNKAYTQLDEKALEYLAQLTSLAPPNATSELRELFARLVDHWADATEEASAGVAVATSYRPTRAFTTMSKWLSKLDHALAWEGLVTSIPNYSTFCTEVRNRIWSVL